MSISFSSQTRKTESPDPTELPGWLLDDTGELLIIGDVAAAIAAGEYLEVMATLRDTMPSAAGWMRADAAVLYGTALALAAQGLAVSDAATLGRACEAQGLSAGRAYDLLAERIAPTTTMAHRHATDLRDLIARRNVARAAVAALADARNPAVSTERIAADLGRVAVSSAPAPTVVADRWPDAPDDAIWHGPLGDAVEAIDPHTESDRAAVLIHLMVMFGSMIGRGPYFRVDGADHRLNLFAVCVGDTSKGRKGTAGSNAQRVMAPIDETWAADCCKSGLSSGEGLIYAVRDAQFKGGECVDEGVTDKRLLVTEPEFGKVLKVAARDGNTVSAQLRLAWDNGNLRVMTKTPTEGTNAYISIIGHITSTELTAGLTATDTANGFGNRFLWVCVRRSKMLPRGGNVTAMESALEPLRDRLRQAVEFARTVGEMGMTDAAWELWDREYPDLSGGHPGTWGLTTSRAEAQVRRIACLYALADCRDAVDLRHLRAALAVWDYADRSAAYLFGGHDAPAKPADDVAELVAVVESLGGRATLNDLRFKKRKYRAAGVVDGIVTRAITAGRLRWSTDGPGGPGRPRSAVEIVAPTGGSETPCGSVVAVAKPAETAEIPNIATATTATRAISLPPGDDRIPTNLEEFNASATVSEDTI